MAKKKTPRRKPSTNLRSKYPKPARKKAAKKAGAKKAKNCTPENRTGSGQFRKGHSGNPGGRPKADQRLKDLAQEHTETALSTLVQIMKNQNAPTAARVSAACAVLDRGYGRPAQSMEFQGKDGAPLPTNVEIHVIGG